MTLIHDCTPLCLIAGVNGDFIHVLEMALDELGTKAPRYKDAAIRAIEAGDQHEAKRIAVLLELLEISEEAAANLWEALTAIDTLAQDPEETNE